MLEITDAESYRRGIDASRLQFDALGVALHEGYAFVEPAADDFAASLFEHLGREVGSADGASAYAASHGYGEVAGAR